MANNIKSRIYKNRICAMKYAKKVNGKVVKNIDIEIIPNKHNRMSKEHEKITYVVYYGSYIPINS